MVKLIYIFADDWCGIYVNNDLIIENHSIDFESGVAAIDYYFLKNSIEANQFTYEKWEINQEWIENEGSLPNRFDDIPADVLM